jgi:hypothetical protein
MKIIKTLILIFVVHLLMNIIVFANATDNNFNEIVFSVNKNMINVPKSYKNGIFINSNNIVNYNLEILLNEYDILSVNKAFQEISPDDSIRFSVNGKRINITFLNNIFIIKLNNIYKPQDFIDKMKNISGVGFVEYNNIKIKLCGDPNYSNQWYLKNTGQYNGKIGADINIEPVWQFWTGNSNNKVAVIDCGVLFTHNELLGRVSGDPPETGTNMSNCSKYHATMIAGIIGASHNDILIKGINPNTQIISKKIFTETDEVLSATEVANKIIAAVDEGAEVINCSWIYDDDDYSPIKLAFKYAYYMNRTCVCAMGNNNDETYRFPVGFFPEVIAVGSSTDQDQRSGFSNFQSYLDIVAPGGNQGNACNGNNDDLFLITGPDNNSYTRHAGTSFSAPQVTGVASLMKSYKPELYNDDIRGILRASADDIGSQGWDKYTGYGRLNANNAFNFLKSPYSIERNSTTGGIENTPPSELYQKIIFDQEHGLFGVYYVKQHLITKPINFTPREFVKVWIREIESLGWGVENPQYNDKYCWVLPNSLTNNSVTFGTYIYEVWEPNYVNGNLKYLGYYPCQANQTVFAYSILSGPTPPNLQPPLISNLSQSPALLTSGNSSTFTCNLSSGSGSVNSYNWSVTNNSGYNITYTPSNSNQFTIHWNPTDNNQEVNKNILITCIASSVSGISTKSVNTLYLSNTIGGCPWLVVTDQDSNYSFDNNLLHKSQFPDNAGQNIFDKYVLSSAPGIFDSLINLSIVETAQDTSVFDMVKLYAVDHDAGTQIGITEDNEIVMYAVQKVRSTEDAAIYDTAYNYTDITKQIQFYIKNSTQTPVDVDTLSEVAVAFDYRLPPRLNLGILGLLEFNNTERRIIYHSVKSDFAGYIAATTFNPNDSSYGEFDIDFSGRENLSPFILPVSLNMLSTVTDVSFSAYRNLRLKYLSLVELKYQDNFTVTELPLYEAFNSLSGDVTHALYDVDDSVTTVNPDAYLNLKFQNVPTQNTDLIRDYVIEVNGRVFVPTSNEISRQLKNSLTHSTTKPKYKLNQNYPNPFNPVTKISYSIEKLGLVTLKIYDILGREIKTLVNEIKTPGDYSVELNGSNFSSGVYFYRIQSGDFIQTKRMLLIK